MACDDNLPSNVAMGSWKVLLASRATSAILMPPLFQHTIATIF